MHSLLQSCQVRREAVRSPLGAGCEICRKVPRAGRTRRAASRSPVGINRFHFSCCDIFCVLASSHGIVDWLLTPFRRAVALSSPSPQSSSVDGASTQALASILSHIGASELLQNFIDDDRDDDSLISLSRLKCERLADKYRLSVNQASAFVEKCGGRTGVQLAGHAFSSSSGFLSPSHSPLPPLSTASRADHSASSSPAPAAAAPPMHDASLLLKLNLEIICELGQGGFGKVYKCKDVTKALCRREAGQRP